MRAPLPFDAWASPGRDAFEFWIGFFPTAPLFGVEWRFADMLHPSMAPFMQMGAMRTGAMRTGAMQTGAMSFPMAFPGAGAAAAAARPGELDTPARADDGAARPAARMAGAAADIAGDAGRVASGVGGAVARTADAALTAGTDAGAKPADAGRDGAPDAAAENTPMAEAVADLPALADDRPSVEALAGENSEGEPATQPTAETAEDDAPRMPTGPEAVDAAIAAAPRPAVLLDERPDDADDLKAIKGIGGGLERQLNALGVWTLDQIARMTDADLAWIDARLTTVPGRIFRDDWIGQAKARLRE